MTGVHSVFDQADRLQIAGHGRGRIERDAAANLPRCDHNRISIAGPGRIGHPERGRERGRLRPRLREAGARDRPIERLGDQAVLAGVEHHLPATLGVGDGPVNRAATRADREYVRARGPGAVDRDASLQARQRAGLHGMRISFGERVEVVGGEPPRNESSVRRAAGELDEGRHRGVHHRAVVQSQRVADLVQHHRADIVRFAESDRRVPHVRIERDGDGLNLGRIAGVGDQRARHVGGLVAQPGVVRRRVVEGNDVLSVQSCGAVVRELDLDRDGGLAGRGPCARGVEDGGMHAGGAFARIDAGRAVAEVDRPAYA